MSTIILLGGNYGRRHSNCKNFRKDFCNLFTQELGKKFLTKEKPPGKPVSYFSGKDIEEANRICSECDKFEPEDEPERS